MKRGYRASITIYLTLMFAILLSLIFTVVEDVRMQVASMQAECAMDLSLYSVFAEYNRELLEQYDLLFIDTGYGTKEADIRNTARHLKDYMQDNFEVDIAKQVGTLVDFTRLHAKQAEITSYTTAADEVGAVFKRQAVSYMEDQYGISYFKKIKDSFSDDVVKDYLTEDVTARRNANEQKIDAVELPKKKISKDEYEEIKLDNPADAVNATRGVGILNLVVKDVGQLSQSCVNPEAYISHRSYCEGNGLLRREKVPASKDVLYHEYILEKCSCYTNPLAKSELKYQTEYILAGKSSDIDNLKWVVNRLLLMRETANAAYLFADAAKVAEAEALALTLAAVAAVPELCELVKISILFAWSYAESVYDVKQLLGGGRVPLIKDAQTWHYSLEGMLCYQNELATGNSDEEEKTGSDETGGSGLCYKDYLRLLLVTASETDSVMRMMDIVEMDVRKTKGNANFRLDVCIDFLEADVIIKSDFGQSMQIIRSYSYF